MTDEPRSLAMTHAASFVPATDRGIAPLVLLHGSDGNETDLMPLADKLAPGAAKLGVRGAVAMDTGYAFFRRFPDRRVDEADVAARVPVLTEFIQTSFAEHRISRRPLAVGFSNGAIMAAALLMARPGLFAGAILFRPLSPFTDELHHRLDRTPVLVVDGAEDCRRSAGDGGQLVARLRGAGALVAHQVLPVGHALTEGDLGVARDWLRAIELDQLTRPDVTTGERGMPF